MTSKILDSVHNNNVAVNSVRIISPRFQYRRVKRYNLWLRRLCRIRILTQDCRTISLEKYHMGEIIMTMTCKIWHALYSSHLLVT
jgi:hypothetical protein